MDLSKNFENGTQKTESKSASAQCVGTLYRFSNAGKMYAVSVYLGAKNPLLIKQFQRELQKLDAMKEAAQNSMTFSDFLLENTRTFAQIDYNKTGEKLVNDFRKFGAYTLDPDMEKDFEL